MLRFIRKYELPIFFSVVLTTPLGIAWLVEKGVLRTTFFELAFLGLPPAALAMATLTGGQKGARDLLSTVFRVRIHWGWYVFAFVLFPVIGLASVYGYRLFWGLWDKPVVFDWYDIEHIEPWTLMMITLISIGDEVAWFSYAFPRMKKHFRPIPASLLIGVVWFLWYWPRLYISDMVADPSIPIPLFFLHFVAMGSLSAWAYQSTRSGAVLVIMQVVANYAFLVMPVLPQAAGNYYPFAMKVVAMAATTVILVALFGTDLKYKPRTK